MEDLIYRVLAGEASREECGEVKRWLEESEEHRTLYRSIEQTWYMGKYATHWKKDSKNAAWFALEKRYHSHRRIRQLRIAGSVAAAVAILLGAGIGWFRKGEVVTFPEDTVLVQAGDTGETKAILVLSTGRQVALGGDTTTILEKGAGIRTMGDGVSYEQDSGVVTDGIVYNELIVAVGGEYKLRLADGTMVYLNSASKLKFPVNFAGGKREVILEGEGYFDVTADAARPFLVHTSTVEVSVLGTSFNVMAYTGDPRTEVTLVTGKVNVKVGECQEILRPAQQLVLNNRNQQYEVKTVDVSAYVDWKEGIMNFTAMPLEELCGRLSRWYHVRFVFAQDDLKRLKFSGAVQRNDDMGYILTLLEAMTPDVVFRQHGEVITVRKK